MKPSSLLNQHQMVRVAAVTPAVHLGDVAANVRDIIASASKAAAQGAQLIVFPELCLTGYSCADLFTHSSLRNAAERGLSSLIEQTKKLQVTIVVGLPFAVSDRLYNVAAVVSAGRLLGLVPKSHLPNAGEFYERRWFSPASTLTEAAVSCAGQTVAIGTDLIFQAGNLPDCRFAIEVCEDLWTVVPPSSIAALAGATILLNPSASDELLGKAAYRRQLVTQQSGRCVAAYVYAASGPGESSTDVVYSGHSIVAENGALLVEAPRFQFTSSFIIADVDLARLAHDRLSNTAFRDEAAPSYRRIEFQLAPSPAVAKAGQLHRPLSPHPFVPHDASKRDEACSEIFAIQSTGLARRIMQLNAKTVVLGLSGGLDSTLALLAGREALLRSGSATQLLAVTMPGFGTSEGTLKSAKDLARALGVQLRTHSAPSRYRPLRRC